MEKNKIIFIINSAAGKKYRETIPQLITEHLDQKRYVPYFAYTNYGGHATELAKKYLKKGFIYIVAVGGDGTVNEIGKALIGTKGTMGILPAGSGNGLARHLKIPMTLKKAIQVINHHKIIKIDYGIINDNHFFCTCGVGFDANIGKKFAAAGKRGFETYIKTTISSYFKYKPKKYTLKINNKKIKKRAFLITFANASQYGNNAYIAPNANIQDGLMDISILYPFPTIRAIELGTKLFTKKLHKSKYLETIKAQTVRVSRKKKGAVHLDGEPYQFGKKLNITIIRKGLKMLVSQK